ncbi:hypothetical protein FHY17_003531 [Xanthomonas arboricola]|uniref:hypothetical protein n=1 Tax=Xanthomonas arboricola TaxID=56448 RepID=UPI0017E8E896|nr:hypothetical protein [Xanthomonas arboricola]MBB4771382.1 hypothetical protein [Xanthomonas arboricola]
MLKFSTKVAIALWVAKGITGLMGNNTEGLSSQALQQGGIGLLLTTLIITTYRRGIAVAGKHGNVYGVLGIWCRWRDQRIPWATGAAARVICSTAEGC